MEMYQFRLFIRRIVQPIKWQFQFYPVGKLQVTPSERVPDGSYIAEHSVYGRPGFSESPE
jgi:hypothetical protein